MAITSSAKKAHRASLKKHVFNVRRKRALTGAVKETKKLIVAGKKADADKSLSAAFKALDKAAKRGVIKKNTASRRKSRLAKAVAKVS
jgi:small subunit ribosomal protein S20